MDAIFNHGDQLMVPHTASGAISAGDVIVVGDEVRIAHHDIANGALGSLAAPSGQGVYKVAKVTTGGSAIAAGKKVYWNAGSSVATETVGSNKPLGVTESAAVDADATVLVRHDFF